MASRLIKDPALVEALVALSDCLQRERTAIRILMELLVNHLPDLETGRVVLTDDAITYRRVEYPWTTTRDKIYAIPDLDNFLGDRLGEGR